MKFQTRGRNSFQDREAHMKRSSVLRSLSVVAGVAVVSLSACTTTTTTPAPESSAPTSAATSSSSSQASPTPTQNSPVSSDSTSLGSQPSASPDFSADSFKVLEHKIIDDPTGKNLQIKVEAPANTSFFSGTSKAPCEAKVIDTVSAAPGSSISPSDPSVTYLLRCQDENPTKLLTVSTKYSEFDHSFEIALK